METEAIGVEVVRRHPNGEWPDDPVLVETGSFRLDSIGMEVALTDLYADTMLDPA